MITYTPFRWLLTLNFGEYRYLQSLRWVSTLRFDDLPTLHFDDTVPSLHFNGYLIFISTPFRWFIYRYTLFRWFIYTSLGWFIYTPFESFLMITSVPFRWFLLLFTCSLDWQDDAPFCFLGVWGGMGCGGLSHLHGRHPSLHARARLHQVQFSLLLPDRKFHLPPFH